MKRLFYRMCEYRLRQSNARPAGESPRCVVYCNERELQEMITYTSLGNHPLKEFHLLLSNKSLAYQYLHTQHLHSYLFGPNTPNATQP